MRIQEAHDGKHKYVAEFEVNGKKKKTSFGAKGYQDYLEHHDDERKARYLKRHQKDLKTNNPLRAGYLSYYILWNKPTLEESIADYKNRFHL